MSGGDEVDRLVDQLRLSSWVGLQDDIVALARVLGPNGRAALARAVLASVLRHRSSGTTNPLSPEAFALLLDAAPHELELNLAPSPFHGPYGGRRHLLDRVWSIPGRPGALWLSRLARADDSTAATLARGMGRSVRMWTDDEWPDRLEALTALQRDPRPAVIRSIAVAPWPRTAAPAMFRLALVHGRDETDHLVRKVAERLRSFRSADAAADVDLVDWEACGVLLPTSSRWLLELMGAAGQRGPLVNAAVESGLLDAETGEVMKHPIERPAWADGEVPWVVDEVAAVGDVEVAGRRLGGGDPFLIGGEGGRPSWEIEIGAERAQVHVIVARHPLHGRECGALQLVADPAAEVARWAVVPTSSGRPHYTVEVGVASVGAVEAYASGLIFEQQMDFAHQPRPAWAGLRTDHGITMVLCSVGPQHQQCRTWVGTTDDGRTVATVTDLGLLDLDPARDPQLPWT